MTRIKFTPTRMSSLDPDWVKGHIEAFLHEDAPEGDITTLGTVPAETIISAQIQAVEEMVFAGIQVIQHCFDGECRVEFMAADGDLVNAGQVLGTITGPAHTILTRERLMLNLVQRLSGIATQTRAYAEKVARYGVVVLDTRKTTPGLRLFEKYAVAVGGGYNHRMDLSSAVMIKDNHLQLVDDIGRAVAHLRTTRPDIMVELEVESREHLIQGLDAGVDALLLDNMPPEQVREFIATIREHPNGRDIFVEASGGITLDDIARYARTGVDGISVGALTHSIPSADIRLEIQL